MGYAILALLATGAAAQSTTADLTCPHFTAGDDCATNGCATVDESGSCLECCEGCVFLYNVHGSTCSNGGKKKPSKPSKPSKPPSASPSYGPTVGQCASRDPSMKYSCYYQGCKTADAAGKCTECCDGCRLEYYSGKGDICMEDSTWEEGTDSLQTLGPTPDQCASRDPSMKFGCYHEGCKTVDAAGKCIECCDGCHLEQDATKGDICMEDSTTEDGTDSLQTPGPKPEQCASRDPSMKFGCYHQGCKTVDAAGKCTECCDGCHLEYDVTKGDICMEDNTTDDSTDLLQPPGPKPGQCASRDPSMKFGCYYQGCKTVDAAGTCIECCDGCRLEHDVTKGDICMEDNTTDDSTDLLQPPGPKPGQCASRDPSMKFGCYYQGCKTVDAAGTCIECCDGCHLEQDATKGDICMEDNTTDDSTDLLQPPGPTPGQCASRDPSMKFGCYYQGCKTVDAAGTCIECCDGCRLEHDVTKGDICMEDNTTDDSTDLLQPPGPTPDQCASRDPSMEFGCFYQGCKTVDAAGTCIECCDGCHLEHDITQGDICMEGSTDLLQSPGPKPDQCASRDKSRKYDCYYQGCKTVDAAGTCTECCDGCHLEHDVTQGHICMEDSTVLLQSKEPESKKFLASRALSQNAWIGFVCAATWQLLWACSGLSR